MARLSLPGLADLVAPHWRASPGEPLVLPSFLGPARQDAIIALQHQLLGRGRVPWLTLTWRDGVMPYDQRTLDARVERHGPSGFFVEVIVEEPDLDLNRVQDDPALRPMPYWAIRCTTPTRNGRLGSLRGLRDATHQALRIEYELLSDELGLDPEKWSIAEPVMQTAIDPASVLAIVDGLVDIQLQSVPAEDQRPRLLARALVEELAHVPPAIVAGLLSIAAGKRVHKVERWLESAFLYRDGQLRRWAAFLAHADAVDAVVAAFDERAARGLADARELKTAVKALSKQSARLRIDVRKAPELQMIATLIDKGQLDDAEHELDRLGRRIDDAGATPTAKGMYFLYRSELHAKRGQSELADARFEEAARLLRNEEPTFAAHTHFLRGLELLSSFKPGRAEVCFRTALELLTTESAPTETSNRLVSDINKYLSYATNFVRILSDLKSSDNYRAALELAKSSGTPIQEIELLERLVREGDAS